MVIDIQDHFYIKDLETLKLLSDPTRLEIIKHVGFENKTGHLSTVKKVAKRMKVAPTKLYYHVKLLEEKGFLIVGDTKIVSGIIEKHYHVIAHNISMRQVDLSGGDDLEEEVINDIFNSAEQIINASVRNSKASLSAYFGGKTALQGKGNPAEKMEEYQLNHNFFLLSPEKARDYQQKLLTLFNEYKKVSDKNYKNIEDQMLVHEITQLIMPQYQNNI